MDRRQLMHRARELRRLATPAERAAWQHLRARRCLGYKFRRQYPFRGFVLDFFCRELALAIELDGDVHEDPTTKARDQARDEVLAACGLRVVRVPNHEVSRQRFEEVVRQVPPLRVCGEGDKGVRLIAESGTGASPTRKDPRSP